MSSKLTLVTLGYSFGDEHTNRVIEDMPTISSTHLVVIAYDDPLSRIMKMYERLGRHAQIGLLVGDRIGEFRVHSLCRPAVHLATRRPWRLYMGKSMHFPVFAAALLWVRCWACLLPRQMSAEQPETHISPWPQPGKYHWVFMLIAEEY